jgi:transcriptional regulator of acetoin/glycerol metabolism/DNA-binding CsgD family transcriptional regulator
MVADARDASLRNALAALVRDGRSADRVPPDIAESWRRSLLHGLVPERLVVGYEGQVDTDGALVRAAGPVVESLRGDLTETRTSVVLADEHGQVIDRRILDVSLERRLDRVSLAPGFVYAEDGVGTNGVGTALQQRGSAFVRGDEHFAEDLIDWACAGAAITDPRTGRVVGVIDLTCPIEDANPLMMPLMRRAAAEIEQRLLDDSNTVERAALTRFLRERRHAKTAIVFAYRGKMITNTAADRIIGPADELILWPYVGGVLERKQACTAAATLADGTSVVLRCEPVLDGSTVVGALVSIRPSTTGDDRLRARRERGGRTFGWDSLTDSERSVVALVSQGMTNREIGERLFVSHHTVDFHLRAIFRKVDVSSRVALTRLALEHSAA